MENENFYLALTAESARGADAPFLTLPDGARWTYGRMNETASRMAGALCAAGAAPGDRILVQTEKSAETIALYLGALRAGLVYTPLNTAYTDEEVAYFLSDAEPAILICDPARRNALVPLAEKAGVKAVLTRDAAGGGDLANAAGTADPAPVAPRAGDDLAAILYTSGTTGRSKGAMLSHRALNANARALVDLWAMSAADRLLHALPVFHIHGLFVALHTAMIAGAEVLYLRRFDVADVLRALPRATVMMGVPTFYSRLLAEPDFTRAAAAHMRLFISGSAPLTEETFAAFAERTGHTILERYGMSEAGMIASNPLDGARVAGTVGFALPGVAIRITDEAGDPQPEGVPGNVEIKSPALFSGYWRMPEKTQAEFRDGWFVTGDIGSLDGEGRLTLSGRAKDLIIAGGYNIYPKEIEAVLEAVPGVSETAVIGVPHGDMGEGVVAVIVGAAPEAALRAAAERLARFKRPRRYVFIDALPRNTMGKVQKQVLRDRFADAFTRDDRC